jgi:hypothetical protein
MEIVCQNIWRNHANFKIMVSKHAEQRNKYEIENALSLRDTSKGGKKERKLKNFMQQLLFSTF